MKKDDFIIYQAYTWKHSFHDFEKVLKIIEESKTIQNPDQFHHFGVIHFFEISFELAWKIMKDYLEAEGFLEIKSPRDAIKQAFNIELIVQGHLWLEALENRNLSVHTYNEALANELVNNIKNNYLPLLLELKNKLSQKI